MPTDARPRAVPTFLAPCALTPRPRSPVDGFRPKLLAVRPARRAFLLSPALSRPHVYGLCTLLGLSLPYRLWFARRCDEIRVTVTKEARCVKEDADEKEGDTAGSGKASWFRGGRRRGASAAAEESRRAQELFRQRMQSFSLYGETPSKETATTSAAKDGKLPAASGPAPTTGPHGEHGREDGDARDEARSAAATRRPPDVPLDAEEADSEVASPDAKATPPPPPASAASPKQDTDTLAGM